MMETNTRQERRDRGAERGEGGGVFILKVAPRSLREERKVTHAT